VRVRANVPTDDAALEVNLQSMMVMMGMDLCKYHSSVMGLSTYPLKGIMSDT
jgi:hypothetical protein